MAEDDYVRNVLIEELEALLELVAPDEADAAALYVNDPQSFDAVGREEVAGVPGGGVGDLVGPILANYLAKITLELVAEIRKQGIESIARGAWEWLASFVSRRKTVPDRGGREETVKAVVGALIHAGWSADRAGRAAERLWAQGERAAKRLRRR